MKLVRWVLNSLENTVGGTGCIDVFTWNQRIKESKIFSFMPYSSKVFSQNVKSFIIFYICILSFGRWFYPKRLTSDTKQSSVRGEWLKQLSNEKELFCFFLNRNKKKKQLQVNKKRHKQQESCATTNKVLKGERASVSSCFQAVSRSYGVKSLRHIPVMETPDVVHL